MTVSSHIALVAAVVLLVACGPLTATAHRKPSSTKQHYGLLGDDCLQVITMTTALKWDMTKAPGAKAPADMNAHLAILEDPTLQNTLLQGTDYMEGVVDEMRRHWFKPVGSPEAASREGHLPQYWYRAAQHIPEVGLWGLNGYGTGPRFRRMEDDKDEVYKPCVGPQIAAGSSNLISVANTAIDAENEENVHSEWCVVNYLWDDSRGSKGAGVVVCPRVMLDTVGSSRSPVPSFVRDAQRNLQRRNAAMKLPTSKRSRRSPLFSGHRDFGVLDGSKCFRITRTHSQELTRWFYDDDDFPLAPPNTYTDSHQVIDLAVRSPSNEVARTYSAAQARVNPAGWFWVRKGTIPVYVWRRDQNPTDNLSPRAVHANPNARQSDAPPVAPCLKSYPAERFGSLDDVRQRLGIGKDTPLCTVARKVVPHFYKAEGRYNEMPTYAHVSTICPVERLAARRRYRWFGAWRPRAAM